jgi:hypothetical protein
MFAHAFSSCTYEAISSTCSPALKKTFLFKRAGSGHALACILASHRLFAFREERTSIKLKNTTKQGKWQDFWFLYAYYKNPLYLETIKHKFDVIKQHCETVGRDYESIHRTSTTFCSIADTDEQAQA